MKRFRCGMVGSQVASDPRSYKFGWASEWLQK